MIFGLNIFLRRCDNLIEVKGLVKKYGSVTAVKDLSFKVDDGHIVGFLGPNGAGKSTTMNIITGCLASTSGSVLIDGHDIFEDPVNAKKQIGYLPEIPPLYVDMTPEEYLSFVGMAKGLKKKELEKNIDEVCSVTGISEVRNRLIKHLSKGFRQRVGIAQALIGNPEIVILDEPTVGLDPRQVIEIRNLIKALGKNHTVILSSHILSEVSQVCDEVMIISKGVLVASDTPENLSLALSEDSVVELQVKGDKDKILEAISNIPGVKEEEVEKESEFGVLTVNIKSDAGADLREKIFYAMRDSGAAVISMSLKQSSLEDMFMDLTSSENPEDVKEKLDDALGKIRDSKALSEKAESEDD